MNDDADIITNKLILFLILTRNNALTSLVMNHIHVLIQKPLTQHTLTHMHINMHKRHIKTHQRQRGNASVESSHLIPQ